MVQLAFSSCGSVHSWVLCKNVWDEVTKSFGVLLGVDRGDFSTSLQQREETEEKRTKVINIVCSHRTDMRANIILNSRQHLSAYFLPLLCYSPRAWQFSLHEQLSSWCHTVWVRQSGPWNRPPSEGLLKWKAEKNTVWVILLGLYCNCSDRPPIQKTHQNKSSLLRNEHQNLYKRIIVIFRMA